MGDVERFFASPSAGDVGAPATPISSTASTPGKKRRSSHHPGSGKKKSKELSGSATAATSSSSSSSATAKDPTGQTAVKKISRPLSGFNLAGRPGILQDKNSGTGIKSLTKKVCRPMSPSTVNTSTEWTFVIHSAKGEFFRFFANSMTASIYSVITNPAVNPAGNAKAQAAKWSTTALGTQPTIFLDPSVMGTSFVKSVRVSINGVPVQSNNYVDPHLLHYVRCSRIFNAKPDPFLARADQLVIPGAAGDRTGKSVAQKAMLKPFDHVTWDDTRANRVPIFLDGIWPFDHRNRTIESIDRQPEPPLYLPPDSRLEITVELHRNRFAGVFHNNCHTYEAYFGEANQNASTVETTIEDVLLEYESCELSSKEHDEVIKEYRDGKVGNYDYDIVRSQHQILDANVAYVVKWFQMQPHCRLAYILFLPNHATFSMPATNKPLSAWSRFPAHCTNIAIKFAGEENLITENLENFGVNDRQNEISKKIFFDYMTANSIFAGTFEDLFGHERISQSLVQILPVDLGHLDSAKTERLTVELKFNTANLSPAGQQILVLSVHTNGRAVCSADKTVHDWKWQFQTLI